MVPTTGRHLHKQVLRNHIAPVCKHSLGPVSRNQHRSDASALYFWSVPVFFSSPLWRGDDADKVFITPLPLLFLGKGTRKLLLVLCVLCTVPDDVWLNSKKHVIKCVLIFHFHNELSQFCAEHEKNISKIEVIYIAALPVDWLLLSVSCWQMSSVPSPQNRLELLCPLSQTAVLLHYTSSVRGTPLSTAARWWAWLRNEISNGRRNGITAL